MFDQKKLRSFYARTLGCLCRFAWDSAVYVFRACCQRHADPATADGRIIENGDGTTGLGDRPDRAKIVTNRSVFLPNAVAFEPYLSSNVQGAMSGVQLIPSPFGNSGVLIGSMVLQLQGHAGDGLITAASINPCFHYVGTTVGITLDEIVLKIGTDCAAGTQHVFDIDPMALFGLAGPDDLLSLRCRS